MVSVIEELTISGLYKILNNGLSISNIEKYEILSF